MILKRTGAVPPRIHSLPKLVSHLDLGLPREQMLLLQDLTRYYAGSCYPGDPGDSPLEVSAQEVDRLSDFTKELVAWLKQKP